MLCWAGLVLESREHYFPLSVVGEYSELCWCHLWEAAVEQVILEYQVSLPKDQATEAPLDSEGSCLEVLIWDNYLTEAGHGGTFL